MSQMLIVYMYNNDFNTYLFLMRKWPLYEFQIICFWLSSATRVFTEVLQPVYALEKNGIQWMYYSNVLLIMNKNLEDSCNINTEKMVQKLYELGFKKIKKKSILLFFKTQCFLRFHFCYWVIQDSSDRWENGQNNLPLESASYTEICYCKMLCIVY